MAQLKKIEDKVDNGFQQNQEPELKPKLLKRKRTKVERKSYWDSTTSDDQMNFQKLQKQNSSSETTSDDEEPTPGPSSCLRISMNHSVEQDNEEESELPTNENGGNDIPDVENEEEDVIDENQDDEMPIVGNEEGDADGGAFQEADDAWENFGFTSSGDSGHSTDSATN